MDDDDNDVGQKLIGALQAGSLQEGVTQRELDTCKALVEMTRIVADIIKIAQDTGTRPWPPEEKMRQEAMLIAKWPEACRRAGVDAIPMPDQMMRAIASFVGRAS